MFIKIINRQGKKRQVKRSPQTYEEVTQLAEQIWGEEAKNSSIAYLDSDKELITIVNDDDWSVCMEEVEMMQEGLKVKKVTLKLIPKEELSDSIRIVDTSMISNQSNVTVDVDVEADTQAEVGNVLRESNFSKVNESVVIESRPTEVQEEEPQPEAEVEQPKAEAPVEKQPEGEKQLSEWKMVERPQSTEETEEGDLNIEEETQEETKPEEPSVFEEEANPVRLSNTANNDTLIEVKIDGNDLEALRSQILEMAPSMGFEVEKAEIVNNNVQPEQPPARIGNILNDVSMCETNRSSLTHDMRDEIQMMINQKVQEQLNRTLSSMNMSSMNMSSIPQAQPEEEEVKEEKVVHHGFTCDGCGAHPIVGARFHSLHQKNYDLCSKCEKTMHTEHPMVRFRTATHRGFGHSRGWHAVKKIINKHDDASRNQRNHCRAGRRGNPIEAVSKFFSNLSGNGCQAGNNQGGPVGEVFRAIRKTVNDAQSAGRGRRHRNLCHIRVRDTPNAAPANPQPAPQQAQAEAVPHPRFNEFSRVFTNASKKDVNDFLYSTDHINDENELYNMAIAKFLE